MMAKESKLEGFLKDIKDIKDGGEDRTPDKSLSELEKELEKEDKGLKEELVRTRAEEAIEKRRATIREYRARGGKMGDDSEQEKQEQAEREKRAVAERERLMTQAKMLIDSGMAPQQVGQMLMGLPVTAPGTVAPIQGLTVADALKIVDLVVERKNEGELKALVVSLQREIDTLKRGGGGGTSTPQSPLAYAKEQAEATKAWIEALKAQGVPIGEAARGGGGESIESQREKYRHEERMHELGTERTYKESIATSLGDVVERVGRGAAHQFLDEGGTEEPAGAALAYFDCTEKLEGGEPCGTRIQIPPGATKFTCPKCLTIYGPKEK